MNVEMIKTDLARHLRTISTKQNVIVLVVSVVALLAIIDTSFIRTSVLITSHSSSEERVVSFIIITMIIIIGQFLILAFVRQQTRTIRKQNVFRLNQLIKIVIGVQVAITVILILLILQIVLDSQYYVDLIIFVFTGSSLLSISMLALTNRLFFSWLRSERTPMIISFGIASAVLVFEITTELLFVDLVLSSNQPDIIIPHLGENVIFLAPGSLMAFLNRMSSVSLIVSFTMMWIASSFILRHYSRKWGRVKFWVFISLPLIYYLSQFLILHLN